LEESNRRLAALLRDYPADYLLVRWPTSFPLPLRPLLFQNDHYALFRAQAAQPVADLRAVESQ
jgi:hypothetical protein